MGWMDWMDRIGMDPRCSAQLSGPRYLLGWVRPTCDASGHFLLPDIAAAACVRLLDT